jgi:hypothetical protein
MPGLIIDISISETELDSGWPLSGNCGVQAKHRQNSLTDFGRLLRCAGARTFFAHRYCARAAASATMVVIGTRPMNTKIMWRRVGDPPLFHLANDYCYLRHLRWRHWLTFSKTSISKAWPALVNGDIIAALQLFALALMRCGVSFKVLLDLA